MPFKSDKQRKFMFSNYPEIARKWVSESKNNNYSAPIVGGDIKKPKKTKKDIYNILYKLKK
tara:strand:+ start:916 stop:1098 length:183 start_codon:yes stop_codon:yes gene_type:complete